MTINKRQGGRGNIPTLMKELKFILNQMWSKDPFMYVIVILNSIINGVLPFIWIFAPAYVIDNKDKGLEFFIPFFIGLFILTSLMKFLNSFLTGNYRMRMNNLRYGLNTNIINYSLSLSYSKQQDKKYKEIITDAIRSIQYPFDGFGGIILHMPLIFGLIISLIGYLWIFTALEWWLIIYMIVLTFFSCKFIYKTTFIYDAFWNDIDYTWEQLQQLNYELQSPISKLDILMYDYNTLFKKYYSSITKHWDNEFVKSNSKVFTLNLKAKAISLIRDVHIFYWLISNLQNGNIRLSKFYILFAGLFSFVIIVDNLADGKENYLTTVFDNNGVSPSGGLGQKLALARSMQHKGKFIIMDEPTSALDPRSEQEIFENMLKITEDQTSLFISHRLSSTKYADRIIVCNNGHIEENGNHTELLKANKLYAEMFNTQKELYT